MCDKPFRSGMLVFPSTSQAVRDRVLARAVARLKDLAERVPAPPRR